MGHRLRLIAQRAGTAVRRTAPHDRRLAGITITAAACIVAAAALLVFGPDAASQEVYAAWFALGLGSWLLAIILAGASLYYAIRAGGRWRLAIPALIIVCIIAIVPLSGATSPPEVISPPLPALPRER